ncbi:hypothetical protein ABKN59_002172 [Abortiporus biennis]
MFSPSEDTRRADNIQFRFYDCDQCFRLPSFSLRPSIDVHVPNVHSSYHDRRHVLDLIARHDCQMLLSVGILRLGDLPRFRVLDIFRFSSLDLVSDYPMMVAVSHEHYETPSLPASGISVHASFQQPMGEVLL